MRIDETHRAWFIGSLAALLVAAAAYALYSRSAPQGPNGGTTAGLTYGSIAFAFMIFAGLLGARKKVPIWRIGRAQSWMRAHLWLGFLSFPLILFHSGFRFGVGLTKGLMWMFVVVFASGILGAILQHFMPGLTTQRIPLETIYEQIGRVRSQLVAEAQSIVSDASSVLAGSVSHASEQQRAASASAGTMGGLTVASGLQMDEGASVQLQEFFSREMKPYLEQGGARGITLSDRRRSQAMFQQLRLLLPPHLHPSVDDLENICEEKRELDQQTQYHRILHGWLLVHIPLSYALLLLGAVHAVMALRYCGKTMPRRVRTTKNLAQRMDLQYFKQPHPFRSWRLWLSILIPVVALGWFAVQRANSPKLYSSGPLSAAHAVFGKRCDVCHATTLGFFRAKVSDGACSKCHNAPPHHADNVTFTVSCGSCHVEHQGSLRLASTKDAACTQCHADLRTRNGILQYGREVKDFDHEHPEFAATRQGTRDPGHIKLNHYAHLRPNLAGPSGPVQMDCQDCHRLTAIDGSLPYAGMQPTSETSTAVSAAGGAARHEHSPQYMLPVRYANQCAGCHVKDLQFDKRFEQSAPHEKPEVVRAFLVQKYSDYFASHPGALSEPVAPERILPGKMKLPLPVPHNRQEWMDQQIMLADLLLFGKGCKLCHIISEEAGSLPMVAKSSIPARWFTHAEFDHDSHRLLTCTACHDRAPESRVTADILLPGIASCRSCHQDGGPRNDAASGLCSECHAYHDWPREQPAKGKFTIPQLRAGR